MNTQVTTLSQKAILVKLTMRRATLTKRDSVAEAIIQNQMDDSSLIVNSKLFRDKSNPINKVMSAAGEVYTEHKKRTLPWSDKGTRVLPNAQYLEYTQDMRTKINYVDTLLNKYLPDYDTYVQLDVSYRSKNQTVSRAKASDYPTASEFKNKMGFDLRFMPMPDQRHFLFDISQEDIKAFNDSMDATAAMVRDDAVMRMLTPLRHLVEKLSVPIGQDGHIFRDSALENIIEGIDMASKLTLDESPEIKQLTSELKKEIEKHCDKSYWLRESSIVRHEAAKKLNDIASAMGAFMGAA